MKAPLPLQESSNSILEPFKNSAESNAILFDKLSAAICEILLAFAVYTKLAATLRPSVLFDQRDPNFPFFSLHTTLSLALLVEIAALMAFIALRFLGMKRISWWIMLALASCFTFYRIGGRMLDHDAPCTCLGSMTSGIFQNVQQEETIAFLILSIWMQLALLNLSNIKTVLGLLKGTPRLSCNLTSAFILTASCLVRQTDGASIQVAGTLTAIDFSSDKTKGNATEVQFVINYMEQGRKLFVQHDNGVQSITIQNDQCSFDITIDPKLTNTMPMPAIVRTNFYPILGEWYTTIPWLAFFSDAYLPLGEVKSLPLPWFVSRQDPEAHLCFSITASDSKSKRQLVEVTWKTSMDTLRLATKHRALGNDLSDHDDRKARLVRFDMMYPTNIVLGTFSVLTSTQILNQVIPTEFKLVRYEWNPKISSNLYILAKFHGLVNSISLLTKDSEDDLKQSPAHLSIADFRFVDQKLRVEYVRYHYTNSHLPYAAPSKAQVIFSERIRFAKSYFAKQQARRFLTIAAMTCAIVIPLVIVIKKAAKPRS